MEVEQGFDELLVLGRDRRGARHRRDEPSAQQVLRLVSHHLGFECRAIGTVDGPTVHFALELLKQHVPDPWHEIQFGGPHSARSSNSVERSLLAVK